MLMAAAYGGDGKRVFETAIESTADYTCAERYYNKYGSCKHPDLYPKGNKHSDKKECLLVRNIGVEEKRVQWEIDSIMFGNGDYMAGEIDLTPLIGVTVEGLEQ